MLYIDESGKITQLNIFLLYVEEGSLGQGELCPLYYFEKEGLEFENQHFLVNVSLALVELVMTL